MGRWADESIDGWVDGWVDMSGWPWVGKGVTYGMCEKSRSYASSIACAISSLLGRENAGGSCKSYREFKVRGIGTGERDSRAGARLSVGLRTSTTAPRYLSGGSGCSGDGPLSACGGNEGSAVAMMAEG